jgi:hypothetical protein
MANLYASLDEYHQEKDMTTEISSLKRKQRSGIIRALREASRRIDTFCGTWFYPLNAIRYFDYLNARECRFAPYWLLEVDSFTTGGGDVTSVASTEYDLLTGDTYGLVPYNRLLMHTDSSVTLDIGDRFEQANRITGWWGYHERWSDAWLSSLDTVEDNPLTSSATTLTVNDVDGADADGVVPRFSVGQTLKIESEYVYVANINRAADTLTVVRGQNGTTAAEHAQNVAITIYQPMDEIKKATLLAAAYFRELPQAPFGTVQNLEGTYQIPLTLPPSVVEMIMPYRQQEVGTLHRIGSADWTGRLYPDGVNPWIGR